MNILLFLVNQTPLNVLVSNVAHVDITNVRKQKFLDLNSF